MEPQRNQQHVETDAARAASTPHVVRWVLGIGLLLAIVALTIIWVTGALSEGDIEGDRTASGIIRDRQDQSSDGDVILSDHAARIDEAPEIGGEAQDTPLGTVRNDPER